MPQSQLAEMVRTGNFDAFEAGCLEMIENGPVAWPELAKPFQQLQKARETERAQTLGQLLLESAADVEPAVLLPFLAALLNCCPDVEDFRLRTLAAYRAVHGDKPIFDVLLDASELEGPRSARRGLKLMETCLPLCEGSTLIGLGDDKPAIVTYVDTSQALFTLKTTRRVKTLGASELLSEYEPVDQDDFRVLRSFRPERLAEMAASEPVHLVINMIRAHGDTFDADLLKEQLTPKVVAYKDWGGWWTKTRAKLKRCPNVIIEGRSPVQLSYTEHEVTLEGETRAAFEKEDQPAKWLALIEAYLKEKRRRKEKLDQTLCAEVNRQMQAAAEAARARRPHDALAVALVMNRVAEQGFPIDETGRHLAGSILSTSQNPVALIAGLNGSALWERAISLLKDHRPDDAIELIVELIPRAPEALLDTLLELLVASDAADKAQPQIDAALSDPVKHTALLYWLWKGPRRADALQIPVPRDLLATILGTLSALGRSEGLTSGEVKHFRMRMKAALAIRNYKRFRAVLEQIDEASAVTVRRQLDRMDGLGDNAPTDMLNILRDRHPKLWVVKGHERWEDPDVLWTTQPGMQAKRAAIDELVNVKMRENAKAIGAAAEHGDLSENSEYKFALEERDMLRARLAQMNGQMVKARVFERDDVPTDHIGVGSRVTIVDTDGGTERVMTFFGPWEANVERGIFNYLAPIGQKLMGCRVGDRITIKFEGKEREFEVRDFGNGFDAVAGPPEEIRDAEHVV